MPCAEKLNQDYKEDILTIDIWQKCQGQAHITSLSETVWRVVEAQHKSSTRKLVDNAKEHEILEDLIEGVKPKIKQKIKPIHYLLFTPFRYPPLRYGSRFGTTSDPSLWYGSLSLSCAFIEVAFYRLLFLSHTKADLGLVETALSGFAVRSQCERFVDLCKNEFNSFRQQISSPVNYQFSQALGQQLRQKNIQGFHYYSARDPNGGVNVAYFTPDVFNEQNPHITSFQTWQCLANEKAVEFIHHAFYGDDKIVFQAAKFFINGSLPYPPTWVTEKA